MSHTESPQLFLRHDEDLFRFLVRRIKCVFTARDMTHNLCLEISATKRAAGRRYTRRLQSGRIARSRDCVITEPAINAALLQTGTRCPSRTDR